MVPNLKNGHNNKLKTLRNFFHGTMLIAYLSVGSWIEVRRRTENSVRGPLPWDHANLLCTVSTLINVK